MYSLQKYKFFHNLGLATNICKIVINFFATLCPPHLHSISNCVIFYRPCSTNTFVINSFIQSLSHWAFASKSSKYHKSQTQRDRELIFWENVQPSQHVTCYMSHVTCHVSHTIYFLISIFFWQRDETYWWRICYNGAYPCLFFLLS